MTAGLTHDLDIAAGRSAADPSVRPVRHPHKELATENGPAIPFPGGVVLLSDLFGLDVTNGLLVSRARPRSLFTSDRAFNTFHSRFAGLSAGSVNKISGYTIINRSGRLYLAHRIIFAMFTGQWPSGQIDHINGLRSDNRPSNLRDVTVSENRKNSRKSANNRSGATGVDWCKKSNKWRARIKSEGKEICLGYFELMPDAIVSRKAAELSYGFHPNHGRS